MKSRQAQLQTLMPSPIKRGNNKLSFRRSSELLVKAVKHAAVKIVAAEVVATVAVEVAEAAAVADANLNHEAKEAIWSKSSRFQLKKRGN